MAVVRPLYRLEYSDCNMHGTLGSTVRREEKTSKKYIQLLDWLLAWREEVMLTQGGAYRGSDRQAFVCMSSGSSCLLEMNGRYTLAGESRTEGPLPKARGRKRAWLYERNSRSRREVEALIP